MEGIRNFSGFKWLEGDGALYAYAVRGSKGLYILLARRRGYLFGYLRRVEAGFNAVVLLACNIRKECAVPGRFVGVWN